MLSQEQVDTLTPEQLAKIQDYTIRKVSAVARALATVKWGEIIDTPEHPRAEEALRKFGDQAGMYIVAAQAIKDFEDAETYGAGPVGKLFATILEGRTGGL